MERKVCPSLGLPLRASRLRLWKAGEDTTRAKTFVASACAARSASRAARSPRVLPVSLSPLSARGRAIQKKPCCNTVPSRAVRASVVVLYKKKKLRRKKRSSVPSQSQPGEGKKKPFLSSVRQVAFPQLSGFSLVPFGRIFAALRHLSSAAEPRLTRSTEIKRREK